MKCEMCGAETFVMIQCKGRGHRWYAGEVDEFVKNHPGAFTDFKPTEYKKTIRPNGTIQDDNPIPVLKYWEV